MIKMLEVKDIGSIDRERIVFEVTKSGNIGTFMLHCARSVKEENGKSSLKNDIYHSYWFIDKDVSIGDLVVVYTKKTNVVYKEKSLNDSNKTRFFYWGMSKPLWDREGVALVYGEFSGWKTNHFSLDAQDIEPI